MVSRRVTQRYLPILEMSGEGGGLLRFSGHLNRSAGLPWCYHMPKGDGRVCMCKGLDECSRRRPVFAGPRRLHWSRCVLGGGAQIQTHLRIHDPLRM